MDWQSVVINALTGDENQFGPKGMGVVVSDTKQLNNKIKECEGLP